MTTKRNDFLRDSLGIFDKTSVYAIIAIQKEDGAIILRPVGGNWDTNIDEVIKQLKNEYPHCSLKILTDNFTAFEQYCKPHGFTLKQYLS